MSTVLTLLLLVVLFLFVWGIISPASLPGTKQKSITRKQVLLRFGAGALVVFILLGIAAPEPQDKALTVESAGSSQAEVVEPKTTTEQLIETESLPFQRLTRNDATLLEGVSQITIAGVAGTKMLTYELTLVDGKQTDKKLIKEAVTAQPIDEVTNVGTKTKPVAKAQPSASCDPNYSGACVPIASDVDCGGGSGNGPAYVYGTVRVIGSDIYDLDRDGNGLACE
jgi:uncharacterized protein YabE (DUF348 family)